MNAFRTILKPGVSKHTFSLGDPMLTIGSCFAEAMGSRLMSHKVHTLANPFGVIYNPSAIHKAIKYAVFNEAVPELTFLEHDGIHVSYDFHSSVSAKDRSTLRKTLFEITGTTHHFIKEARAIILTYGTAWIYTRNDTGEIVANCHKVPAKEFTRSLLSHKQIITSFDELYNNLKSFNPHCKIILTVSPVRHLRDTIEGNSVSKAILRSACHSIAQSYPDAEYYPAFEIMIDDLRDYRFYKRDMIHPTEEAEDYIWDHFVATYFDEDTRAFFEEWKNIRAALSHKAFHPESPSHQSFLRQTLKKLEILQKKTNVDEEIGRIKAQLGRPDD